MCVPFYNHDMIESYTPDETENDGCEEPEASSHIHNLYNFIIWEIFVLLAMMTLGRNKS